MALVEEHIEGRPFCIITYHTDENNVLCEMMVVDMITFCQDLCNELGLDYLYQYTEDIHELTMYVQTREEGVQLIEGLMQSHIWPSPTDEYRAFWASIFEECGGKWSKGNNVERVFLRIFRLWYKWMDCNHEYINHEIAKYNSENYNDVFGSVMHEVEAICYGVMERCEEARKYNDIREQIPDEILLTGNVIDGWSNNDILNICRMLTVELLQENGIISDLKSMAEEMGCIKDINKFNRI